MSSKRPLILMAILLILVVSYVGAPFWKQLTGHTPQSKAQESPLPGTNSISNLSVEQDSKGRWMASLNYFYTGAPPFVILHISPLRGGEVEAADDPGVSTTVIAQRGSHRATVEIARPTNVPGAYTTTQITAEMRHHKTSLASQQIAQAINWPDAYSWLMQRDMASKPRDAVLTQAVGLIDYGDRNSLVQARTLLEGLLKQDSKFEPAYVELARVAMKSNWGPEGLRQAESLLQSALQMSPESVNAKVLLGYVYTHQERFKEADQLFVDASRTETKNLWLWTNWGELHARQGRFDLAAQKYEEALSRPRTHDTYDRARLEAYSRLIALKERGRDLDGIEATYKTFAKDFGSGHCYNARYAKFVLQQRGDSAAAITLARQLLDQGCTESQTREVLGMAYYTAWAGTSTPDRQELLHQARVFLPAGPKVLYLLGSSDRTYGAAKQLVAGGEAIDQRDNAQINALAYALQARDYSTARRLLQLGARTDTPVGFDDIPVALIPVLDRDFEGVKLMRQSRVDYSKLRYRGTTALDYAKQMGDRQLLEALGGDLRTT